MDYKNSPKLAKYFTCEKCDYICSKQSDYTKHLLTLKHQKDDADDVLDDANSPKLAALYFCECGKEYKHRQGLWKHKKLCDENNNVQKSSSEENQIKVLTNLVLDVVKQNQDLTNKLVDICNKNNSNTNISNNNINSHNKTFNLQFFLNETCKDAMNIMDFANSIIPTIEQTYDTIKMGITKGISQIFVNNLERLPKIQRPIWCADKKRKKLHIMNDNKWSEDTNNTLFETAIKRPVKNMIKIFNESFTHPITNDREIEKWKVGINKLTSDIEKDKVIDNINNIIHYPQ